MLTWDDLVSLNESRTHIFAGNWHKWGVQVALYIHGFCGMKGSTSSGLQNTFRTCDFLYQTTRVHNKNATVLTATVCSWKQTTVMLKLKRAMKILCRDYCKVGKTWAFYLVTICIFKNCGRNISCICFTGPLFLQPPVNQKILRTAL